MAPKKIEYRAGKLYLRFKCQSAFSGKEEARSNVFQIHLGRGGLVYLVKERGVAEELGLSVPDNVKVIQLREIIEKTQTEVVQGLVDQNSRYSGKDSARKRKYRKYENSRFPFTSEILLHATYMDDLVSGSSTLKSAKELQRQLIEVMQAAGLKLHKWHTNFENESRLSEDSYKFDKEEGTKTLFSDNARNPRERTTGPLISSELKKAENFLVKAMQHQEFAADIQNLQLKGFVSPNNVYYFSDTDLSDVT
ncbi:hypothetical protein HNY73_005058 [Argiope bruennichi]|uniref:Uncharacterized protein n=1 Tax=Argiope bruennichi TaxID=94029 RepID=A0A8T0FFA5_ARGBR|nr:hypothetical protein HNY73_005058 [Argiope bruennichi]